MLEPKKMKKRKHHRPKVSGIAGTANEISFGQFGLKAVSGGWVKGQQIEAARRVISRFIKRNGKIWIRVFPHRPITSKGSQTTMGGGKGVPEFYVTVVKPGTIIFEMDGVSADQATEALRLAGYKLPVKTKFVAKR